MAVSNGTIIFIDANNTHAYLRDVDGSSVRIPGKLVDFDKLQKGSRVMLQYDNQYVKGEFKKGATKLLTIEPPLEPTIALGKILRVTDKGNAFARCNGIKGDIFVPAKLFALADVKPGPGMPVLLTVEETVKGFSATELRWKPEELAQVAAVDQSKQAVLKHFKIEKQFGHLIIEGAGDLFFHIKGVKEELKNRFLKGEIPNGSVLGFTIGKHQGRPVALITSVVSLAEVAFEAAEESVADEAAPEPAEATAETNVEAVVEATPTKPKRAARKPKAETPEAAPAKPKAAARKPKAVKPVVDTPVVVAADLPDGPMAEALRGLNLNGSGVAAGVMTH
jgi:cold shock CspA family protein